MGMTEEQPCCGLVRPWMCSAAWELGPHVGCWEVVGSKKWSLWEVPSLSHLCSGFLSLNVASHSSRHFHHGDIAVEGIQTGSIR